MSLNPCACCRRGFDTLTVYHPPDQEKVALCDDCRAELVRDLIEDSSPGFVEILFKRVRYR